MKEVIFFLCVSVFLSPLCLGAEESAPAATTPAPEGSQPAPAVEPAPETPQPQETAPAAESGSAEATPGQAAAQEAAPATEPASVNAAPAQATEEQPAPVEEKKVDTTVKDLPEPAKKEEKAEEKKEVVRPYFGVAIASSVFGLLAMASGFYFDYLAKKSFDKYQKMATPETIREAAQEPGFTPEEYVRKTKAKYDEGHQHIGSRNYAFIGGAVFIVAGIGLYFWTEEKKPEEQKKEEPVTGKQVSVRTDGDRVTLNFSGSF